MVVVVMAVAVVVVGDLQFAGLAWRPLAVGTIELKFVLHFAIGFFFSARSLKSCGFLFFLFLATGTKQSAAGQGAVVCFENAAIAVYLRWSY